ncbi:MAG TPA: hypothetical protein VM658_21295 [bacterium]|nr:hypothetical protein [bacterium]
MKRKLWFAALALGCVIALAPQVNAKKNVGMVLDLSGNGRFFDLPFPSELRRNPDGSINMDRFPNPAGLKMVDRTVDAVAHGYGVSTAPTIYFRFDGPVDAARLPDRRASLAPGSVIFLIDIDPDSPERGRRFPLDAQFYPKHPRLISHADNLLAIMPVPGFILRENTLYAAGVLRSLGDGQGAPLRSYAEVAAQGTSGALGERARELNETAYNALADAGGIAPTDLAALTVFRTGDPTARTRQLFDGVKDLPVLEFETPLHRTREYDLYYVLEGVVMMPQFQDGTPPYGKGKGGRIHFDADGKPITQRMAPVPVAFSVPKSAMPAAGFPIMIYIHGTAGVSTQFIDRGEVPGEGPPINGIYRGNFAEPKGAPPGTGPALIYAQHGIAGVGAAQQHAGERGGLDAQLWWYNFLSPEALRDNMLQATAEASMLLRLLEKISIDPALCPDTAANGAPVKFDPELIFGMGQSLGSLILGPWGAVETDLKALIPSGNGAYWTIFMAQENPLDMKHLAQSGRGLTTSLGLDIFNPVITMLGTALAPGDPASYQRRYYVDPFPGRKPKHVWASFGLHDHYFFPWSQNAAILVMGLDFAGAILEPSTKDALDLAGLNQLDYPVTLNKQTPQGPVTAVAVQFDEKGALDGHHVNFQRDDAKYQYGCFLESLVNGAPTVSAPKNQWNAPCGP